MKDWQIAVFIFGSALLGMAALIVYLDSDRWEKTPYPSCFQHKVAGYDFPMHHHESITLYCRKDVR